MVARRGRAVAERFGLARRFELTLQVGNAYAGETRLAIARIEAAVAAVVGVRRVIGPARLLAVRVDDVGRVTTAPLYTAPPAAALSLAPPSSPSASSVSPWPSLSMLPGASAGASASPGPTKASLPADLTVQSQLARRADALGWFVSSDGSVVRLLIDVDDGPPPAGALEAAVASSGLNVLAAGIPVRAVWPEPARDGLPFAWVWPIELAMVASMPLLVVALAARPRGRRFAVGAVAMAVTVAGPALAAPVGPIQAYGAVMGAAAAGLACCVWVVTHLRVRRRFRGAQRRGWELARDVGRRGEGGGSLARGPFGEGWLHTRVRDQWLRASRAAPLAILAPSLAVVAVAAALAPRLELHSELSHEASLFFVNVRADVAEPVVLRELRRFTDLLRLEPGVAGAWSVADLFAAIPRVDSGAGGIPDDRDLALRILRQAVIDPAVELEVAPDLREALIAVRLEADSGVDPSEVVEGAVQLAGRELRRGLWRIDVTDAKLPLATRMFGRGVLAEDARARAVRLSDRAGHTLDADQRQDLDRSLRRVSLAPRVDPLTFPGDVAREVSGYLEEVALSEHRVAPPQPAQQQRVIDAVLAIPGEARVGDVSRALGILGGPRIPATVREAHAVELRRRLVKLWRRAVTHLAAKSILADADLPTEGGLSDDVRDATLEAMGPIVGLPVNPAAPGALSLDVAVVGGAACDRALSVAWAPRLRFGVTLAAMGLAVLLFAMGGPRALSWWPAAMAPAAVVALVPAVAGIPMGLLVASVLAGALGGGALLSVAASGSERRS